MRTAAVFILCFVFATVAIFTLSNPHTVDVFFLKNHIKTQLFIVILSSLALGVILTFLVSVFEQFKVRRENRRLRKELSNLKEEVDALRNMALKDSYEPEK